MVMDYKVEFGRNVNHQLEMVYGLEFNSEDPYGEFNRYSETKQMSGADFSMCDYVALYRKNEERGQVMLAIDLI